MGEQVVLEAVVVGPGDTLIVRVGRDTTLAEADELKTRLHGRVPGVNVVVLAADQIAAYKPAGCLSVGEIREIEARTDG